MKRRHASAMAVAVLSLAIAGTAAASGSDGHEGQSGEGKGGNGISYNGSTASNGGNGSYGGNGSNGGNGSYGSTGSNDASGAIGLITGASRFSDSGSNGGNGGNGSNGSANGGARGFDWTFGLGGDASNGDSGGNGGSGYGGTGAGSGSGSGSGGYGGVLPGGGDGEDDRYHHAAKSHFAVLSGGHEVSSEGKANAGDHNGHGTATVLVDPGAGKLCYAMIVDGIDRPVAAHIHRARAGKVGPVVVPLSAPNDGEPGTASGCQHNVDRELLQGIHAKPWAFYVNVHTGAYPEGAVRGQLF